MTPWCLQNAQVENLKRNQNIVYWFTVNTDLLGSRLWTAPDSNKLVSSGITFLIRQE